MWSFFQNEVIGMRWLNRIVGNILDLCGLNTESPSGCSSKTGGKEDITKKSKKAFEQVLTTVKKVYPFVVIGVAIGAAIHNWIPGEFIINILGTGNPFGVLIGTAVGVPMYADIFATVPIAEALLVKGAQLGVVLSFLMGVTTLSLPSLIMLRKAVKPRLLVVFTGVCTMGIIAEGYLFNLIQNLII